MKRLNTPTENTVCELTASYKDTGVRLPEKSITESYGAESIIRQVIDPDDLRIFEIFGVLYLNQKNQLLGYAIIGTGGRAATYVDVPLIFQKAILHNASKMMVFHNHPSGNLKPSRGDDQITDKIKEAGEVLSIPMLDHLILHPVSGHYSYSNEGR